MSYLKNFLEKYSTKLPIKGAEKYHPQLIQLLEQHVNILKNCSQNREILDKKALDTFLRKPSVTNIRKICTEIKSKNDSLLASQIETNSNSAKRHKQNFTNISFPTNPTENDSNIRKIATKSPEAKCNEHNSSIPYLNYNDKIALKDTSVKTSNIPYHPTIKLVKCIPVQRWRNNPVCLHFSLKIDRPERISIEMTCNWRDIIAKINEITTQRPDKKVVNDNIKLIPKSVGDYLIIQKFLLDSNIEFFVLQLKSERHRKIVIKRHPRRHLWLILN